MKNVLLTLSAAAVFTVAAHAAPIYTADFSTATYVIATGAFDGSGFGDATLSAGGYADGAMTLAGQYYGDTTGGISGGALNVVGKSSDNGRGRTYGVLLDTSSWAAGDYTVSFSIENFTLGSDAESAAFFNIRSGSGLIDNGGAAGSGALNLTSGGNFPFKEWRSVTALGDAVVGATQQSTITANGLFNVNFSLTAADSGTAGDFVLFGWNSFTGVGTEDDVTSYDVTAVSIAIPEPGTYALLGGLFALGCVTLRRRSA